jgi:hypothetical protein
MNSRSNCEKDILALGLFEGNWRSGESRLQHDVTCVVFWKMYSVIVCLLAQLKCIELQLSVIFEYGFREFSTTASSQEAVLMNKWYVDSLVYFWLKLKCCLNPSLVIVTPKLTDTYSPFFDSLIFCRNEFRKMFSVQCKCCHLLRLTEARNN